MESLPNLEAGKNVLVNVEGVFNGGMIVAFNTPEGSEFRGALLQTSSCSTCGQHQPVLTKSVSSLANPMTYLHDHPYSDLHQYARDISAKMPPRLFLQWNNIPELDAIPSPSSPHKLHSRTHNGKVEHNSPATVVACVNSPPGSYTWPYILKNSEQRTAKCVARRRLQESQELNHIIGPKRGKEGGKVRSKKSRTQSRANSSMSGRKKRSHIVMKDDIDDLEWFESINHDRGGRKIRSLSPRCKVALKELSIPLMKIPVHAVKERKLGQCASLSAGSSTSSSRSSTEQSSRLSSLPLSNSLAYVDILGYPV